MSQNRYHWAARGDFNAFFGLLLDNVAGLVLAVTMLSTVFGFPVEFAIRYMVPGTALGVLIGDLLYFALAFWLARRTGRSDVTAMPLGLDTPSTIGMVLFVLGPAFLAARGEATDPASIQAAAMQTWHVGIWAVLLTGAIKFIFAFGSNLLRRWIPRAGLLGSLAGIALVLIAFYPLIDVVSMPIVGFTSLAVILMSLIGRIDMPRRIPGAAVALGLSCAIFYIARAIDAATGWGLVTTPELSFNPSNHLFRTEWLTVFKGEWVAAFNDAIVYLPYIIPFAIATIIGGIDCTESAATAGDEYHTGTIIGIESVATICAGLLGGVVQTTPYIGHPAYKAMGGRAAYTLATALAVGFLGVSGIFGYVFLLIPKAAIYTILIFIGLEITSQSYHVTPRRHYAALAIAVLPVVARLIMNFMDSVLAPLGAGDNPATWATKLGPGTVEQLSVLRYLSTGFILTSLLWASALAMIIDRRIRAACVYLSIAGILSLFGVIHSPFVGDRSFWPWEIDFESRMVAIRFSASYFSMAAVLTGLTFFLPERLKPIETDEEFDALQ